MICQEGRLCYLHIRCLNYTDNKHEHAPTGKTHQFSTVFFPLFKLHVPAQIFHHTKCAVIKGGNGNNSDLNSCIHCTEQRIVVEHSQ